MAMSRAFNGHRRCAGERVTAALSTKIPPLRYASVGMTGVSEQVAGGGGEKMAAQESIFSLDEP